MNCLNDLATWEERNADGRTTERVVTAMKALHGSLKTIFILHKSLENGKPYLTRTDK